MLSKTAGTSAHDIVTIAASAGGLNALSLLLSALPVDLPAAVLVVRHLDRHHRSWMAEILGHRTALPVKQAEDHEFVRLGTIYVGVPDRHLLINPDHSLSLSQTQLVHFLRPSADLLFESVAATFKKRAIAVVLTGTGSDGSIGVRAIRKMGGVVIAQNEDTSEFYGMPGAAIQTGCVDYVLPLHEIAPTLVRLVTKGEPQ